MKRNDSKLNEKNVKITALLQKTDNIDLYLCNSSNTNVNHRMVHDTSWLAIYLESSLFDVSCLHYTIFMVQSDQALRC